jgi:LuxR family maltose regulon positive regulatory protein
MTARTGRVGKGGKPSDKRCPYGNNGEGNITAQLRKAYDLYGVGRAREADALMEEIFVGLENATDDSCRHKLLGEWTLITMFAHFPDVYAMLPILEQAKELLGGRSSVLKATEPFAFGAIGLFALFHLKPGKADEENFLFAKFVALYGDVTGGGFGADSLFEAELCFHRGEMDRAELLFYKAAYQSRFARQDTIWMGALQLLAQIQIHKSNPKAFDEAFKTIEDATRLCPENAMLDAKLADYARGLILIELEQTDSIAEWIKNGESDGLPYYVRMAVGYLQIRCSFMKNEYSKTLGMAEAWVQDAAFGPVVPAVVWMYMAVAQLICRDERQGIESIEKAVRLMDDDGLCMVFAGFYPHIAEYIDRAAKGSPASFLKDIKKLSVAYAKGWRDVFSSLFTIPFERALTKRELEVARLAAQGLSNREIAERLIITERTVKAHLTEVFQKLGISRRSQLAPKLKNI